MPMEIQIIRAQEFVRLGAKGRFDLKASKAVLAQLAAACCKRGINQALLDLRALQPGPKPMFTPNDLVRLVNTFREIGFTHKQRLAVLYSSDPYHRARLFAFIAKLRGWRVQAFDNFESAVTWLAADAGPTVETEFTPVAKTVPVRQLAEVLATKSAPSPEIAVKAPGHVRRVVNPGKPVKTRSSSAAAPAIVRKFSQPASSSQSLR